jgi:hypothetical protein
VPQPSEISFEAVASKVRRRRIVVLNAASVAAVLLVAAGMTTYLATRHGGGPAAQTHTSVNTGLFLGRPVGLVQSTTVIDPDQDKRYEETFAAPDALQLKYGPTLTAAQAWARLTNSRIGPQAKVQPSTIVLLGSLTLNGYAANTLAYGYRGPAALCRHPTVRVGLPDVQSAECAHWIFLDANTGRLLDNVDGLAGFDGPVVIDPEDNEVFTPRALPAGTSASSAQAVWDAYNRQGDKPIPNGVTVQYGTLTQPTGAANTPHQHYVLRNHPVWAYSSTGGCDPGYGPRPRPSPPGGVCISWTFLDPTTGAELDATQQG